MEEEKKISESNGWHIDPKKHDIAQNTFHEWLDISSYYISLLGKAIDYFKRILLLNAACGIVLSTLSGTLSVAQFNNYGNFLLTVLLITLSYVVAITNGLLKIFQIQEKLEEYIKLRQEWINFSINIVTEMQVPPTMRTSVDILIANYKDKFTSLLKKDIEVPDFIRNLVHTPLVLDPVLGRFRRLKSGKLFSILNFVNRSNRPPNTLESIKIFKEQEYENGKLTNRIKDVFVGSRGKERKRETQGTAQGQGIELASSLQTTVDKKSLQASNDRTGIVEESIEKSKHDVSQELMKEVNELRKQIRDLLRAPPNLPPSPISNQSSPKSQTDTHPNPPLLLLT